MTCEETTTEVLVDILKERTRQDKKWGQQDHPILRSSSLFNWDDISNECKNSCDREFAFGQGDWRLILNEEVAEAYAEAAKGDAKALRTELIQVAAVVVAMIECLDRNGLPNQMSPVGPNGGCWND